jgi:hypothetical protein
VRVRVWEWLAVLCPVLLLLAACGAEPQSEYSEQNRNEFLAACTEPRGDTLLQIKLCQCIFDDLQSEVSYERFVEIEQELLLVTGVAGSGGLPNELSQVIADCVVEEVEL